jgi:hypothetical protein
MTSDGERLDQHVQLVRLLMERDAVEAPVALRMAGALIPETDHQDVLRRYAEQTSVTIRVLEPDVIAEGGPQAWFEGWDSASGYYWRRQRFFLAQRLHRADYEIDSLDRASDRVLAHMGNPNGIEGFAVRGLVVGHVQSGKTANFSALIAKAADAGYRVVIVLSGLHNTLRQQTQRRLQRDLGHDVSDGVGLPEPGRQWVWMTSGELGGDFSTRGTSSAVLQGNDHVILVVKKNKTRLQRLLEWMENRVPAHVPVLVIDDEADQASVNTGGNRTPIAEQVDLDQDDYDGDIPADDELDPSAINLRIRQLLNLFAKCSYVAYTATPFANVLINPRAFDAQAGKDLFPRDFIISLPQPPGSRYVGAEYLFGRDALPGDSDEGMSDGLDVVELVPSHEIDLLVPPPRQSAGFIPSMPESLRQALVDFVLAAAGWLQRSGRDEPCTMLVHTDMRRAMQNPLAVDIEKELAYIRQQWRYEGDQYRPRMRRRWEERFRPVTASVDISKDVAYEVVEPFVDSLLRDGIPVRVLNSDHPTNLDFDAEPALKAVLVGGNKLSRGVTIEGLLVSYYVRETLYYDTLMQMGRWFGYRGAYVDLTRLYSTELLVSCFHDLATAEEELRRQFALYETRGLTPLEFVPKVRTHPVMLVTQRNKMRDAQEVTLSYAGTLVQTLRFRPDETEMADANLKATARFLSGLGGPTVHQGQPTWEGVDAHRVITFLNDFEVIEQAAIDPQSVMDYIRAQINHKELLSWRVLVACASTPSHLGVEDLGIVGMAEVPLIERSRLANDPTSLGVITSAEHEYVGLTTAQITAADEGYREGPFRTKGAAIRAQRPPEDGLLIIYPISAGSQPGRTAKNRVPLYKDPSAGVTLIGYAISFPGSHSEATVQYLAATPAR